MEEETTVKCYNCPLEITVRSKLGSSRVTLIETKSGDVRVTCKCGAVNMVSIPSGHVLVD